MTTKTYIEKEEGCYRIKGTRVSLDSLVYAFWNGQTPESIAQSFEVLTLEEVYGAIAFYLANRAEIDAYLAAAREDFERQRVASQAADPAFYRRLEAARLHPTAG
jgi:uncharacterized protein (DUF433 family)